MISPLAYVDPAAKIGANVTIYPFAYIDADTEIGDGCIIYPHVSVMHNTKIGKNVKIYQGAIIGADPQDFRWKGAKSSCTVGDNTIIREHVIINRGIGDEGGTTIGAGCFIFGDAHIGHDSHIADNCVVGNSTNIAGGVTMDTGSILSSSVVLHENCKVGKYVLIKGGTRISSNVPPFTIMAHNPVTYYGVNAYVMRKHAGYSDKDIDDVAKAYRHIYQCSTSVFNALRRIETDIDDTPARADILNFVRENDMKIAGDRFDMD